MLYTNSFNPYNSPLRYFSIISTFTDEETEAPRDSMTSPGSCSQWVGELGFECKTTLGTLCLGHGQCVCRADWKKWTLWPLFVSMLQTAGPKSFNDLPTSKSSSKESLWKPCLGQKREYFKRRLRAENVALSHRLAMWPHSSDSARRFFYAQWWDNCKSRGWKSRGGTGGQDLSFM
jgi:hypothetical protein